MPPNPTARAALAQPFTTIPATRETPAAAAIAAKASPPASRRNVLKGGPLGGFCPLLKSLFPEPAEEKAGNDHPDDAGGQAVAL